MTNPDAVILNDSEGSHLYLKHEILRATPSEWQRQRLLCHQPMSWKNHDIFYLKK